MVGMLGMVSSGGCGRDGGAWYGMVGMLVNVAEW